MTLNIAAEIMTQLMAESEQLTREDFLQNEEIKSRASQLVKTAYPLEPASIQKAYLDEVLFGLWGLGPIETLLADANTSEIMINGAGQVLIEQGGDLMPSQLVLDLPAIQLLIEKIVSPLGLRVDRSNPLVDACLPDGSRVHIIIPPLAIDGPHITIRRFLKQGFELDNFVADKSMANSLCQAMVDRKNIIISGGTSTGKTTLLNVLGSYIDSNQRVITIEDTAELCLDVKNLVRLQTRPANAEGVGLVTQTDLVKTALRMRPDRILVGEVRGAEALDMIQALNTGNDGSLSTCHANGAKATLTRLETMMLMAGSGLSPQSIRAQILDAIDLIVFLKRTADGKRQVTEIVQSSNF